MDVRLTFLLVLPLLASLTGVVHGEIVTYAQKNDIVEQMVNDGEIPADCAKEEKLSDLIEIDTLDLNSDGQLELLITGDRCACQGARRCYQWVYRQGQNRIELIFGPDPADSIITLKASTQGWRDLKLSGVSGDEICTMIYKFDGRRYQEQRDSFRCDKI